MTLPVSESNEWGQIYPLLSHLAAVASPVSGVNCERDFSTLKRVRTDDMAMTEVADMPNTYPIELA